MGAFSCFGFLISRLLRFCPLAMVERPFDESGAFAAGRGAYRLEVVLRRHPFMTFVVVPDAILRRISTRRERARDAIDFRGLGPLSEPALQSDNLSHRKEMRCTVRTDRTGGTSQNI
jgi:hypothetical protein